MALPTRSTLCDGLRTTSLTLVLAPACLYLLSQQTTARWPGTPPLPSPRSSALFRPRAFGWERGTNKNNNGLMGMLPERKRKSPATPGIPTGTAADSLYDRLPGTVKFMEPNEMRTERIHQEAVIPPA